MRGPLAWVPWAVGGCIALGVASFLGAAAAGLAEHSALDPWIFLLSVVFFSMLTFEGYRTGTVHTRRGVVRYAHSPVRFGIALGAYTLLGVAAVVLFLRVVYLAVSPT